MGYRGFSHLLSSGNARAAPKKSTAKEAGQEKANDSPPEFTKEQVTPTRDSRLRWMQTVVQCTHYIAGAGEQAYLRKEEAPEITFVNRDVVDRSDEAYAG